jgi:hypothetical protein
MGITTLRTIAARDAPYFNRHGPSLGLAAFRFLVNAVLWEMRYRSLQGPYSNFVMGVVSYS